MPQPPTFLTLAPFLAGPLIHLCYLVVRTALVAGGLVAWTRRSGWAGRHRVYRMPLPENQLRWELAANLRIIFFDCSVGGVLLFLFPGFMTVPPPQGLLPLAGTVVLFYLWIEVWFYATHRLLHTKALFFLHRQHHRSWITTPLSARSFSLGEWSIFIAGQLLFRAFAQTVSLPLSAIAVGNFFIYLVNVMIHLGVEIFPASWVRHPLTGWFATPTYHSLHHARASGHYALTLTFLDRIFGTRFPDYEEAHRLAHEGRGPESFGESPQEEPKPGRYPRR